MTGRKGCDARFVAARAAGASVPAAARAAGVSERTAYRWLEDPAVRQQIEEARADIVARAVMKLSAASTEAAETLRRLLYSDMDFARLAAARAILELGAKLRGLEELETRIADLEAQRERKEASEWLRRSS